MTSIADFRRNITLDIYDVSRYIDWPDIDRQLKQHESAAEYLQQLVSTGGLDKDSLQKGLEHEPRLYALVTAMLEIPKEGIGFADGRELPPPGYLSTATAGDLSALLLDLGLLNILPVPSSVKDLFRVALLRQDAAQRRYRVVGSISDRLKSVLEGAVCTAGANHGVQIEVVPEPEWPQSARARAEKVHYVLSVDRKKCIAIASVFQTASGGRQRSQLEVDFPNLQNDLAEDRLNLIVIADGRGVKGAKDATLSKLFSGVASCMTFLQASDGLLLSEIERLASVEPPTEERAGLKEIIDAQLNSEGSVIAKDLPSTPDKAAIAIAAFVHDNAALDIVFDSSLGSVTWRKKEVVALMRKLSGNFAVEDALHVVAQLLGSSSSTSVCAEDHFECSIETLPETEEVFPPKLLVASSSEPASNDLAKKVARIALSQTPESLMSLLIVPYGPTLEAGLALKRLQSALTSNIIVLDVAMLLAIAKGKESPRAAVAKQLLIQSDLIKASPFVLNSVTPERMFYGRESEEASMVATLSSNSVALLGGRRIGKTSLMRHVESRLVEAGFVTYFGDCQTVRDWEGFGRMAQRLWAITPESPFRPTSLFSLIKQLRERSDSKVVILLDEIDHLLDWDKNFSAEQVPEAFFRACRTVSQEASAQFVFSGERTIAERLWDSHSPHWNFCHPLMLRQLESSAARELILKPFRNLQISIDNAEAFSQVAWSRTSGHPQLLQSLGDRLVRALNEKPAEARAAVNADDLTGVADTYAFAEHYLETNWGQATDLERLLSLLVATGIDTLETCRAFLQSNGIPRPDAEIRSGLRMLELYGITDADESGYQSRIEWFLGAIAFYGTPDQLIHECTDKLK